MATSKKSPAERELIAPNGDKRLIRRGQKGRITKSDDLGRSLALAETFAASDPIAPSMPER